MAQTVSTTSTSVFEDFSGSKITFIRRFDAPLEDVWRAWTNRTELEKWWAPSPYRAVTKSFDFRPDGTWFFAMVGENDGHLAAMKYTSIDAPNTLAMNSFFANPSGDKIIGSPQFHWLVEFGDIGNGTEVQIIVTGTEPGALESIMETGFEEGLMMALENLDDHLKSRGQQTWQQIGDRAGNNTAGSSDPATVRG